MRLPVLQDWRKVKLYREGKWPLLVPPYARIPHTDDIRVFDHWVGNAISWASFVVIDTEFVRDTKHLTVIGLGYPGMDHGIQIWLDSLDPVDRALMRDRLLALIARIPIVFQNSMADIPVLEKNLGIKYQDYCRVEDTMLEHAVLWSEWEHTLEFLASVYGKYPKMKHLSQSNPSLYNWGDVLDTICVHEALTEEFRRDPLSRHVYQEQSLRLVPILLERTSKGIRVNKPRVKPAIESYQTKIQDACKITQAYAGWPLNLASEKQLKAYLYEKCKYPIQIDKDTKKPSIDGDAIASLRGVIGPQPDLEAEEEEGLSTSDALKRIEEGADPILESRVMFAAASQIMSHYLTPLVKGNGDLRDRIYPEIKIHAQASGRWSITNPPLQQLPSDLRDIICPGPQSAWIGWDWDQIELRLLAALAGDEPYLRAFRNGEDVHTLNALTIFGLPSGTVLDSDDVRRVFAKRFVYRLNYGGDPRMAGDIPGARQLGLSKPDLVDASNRYLAAHPAMASWRVATAAQARTSQISRTFLGRRRRLLGESKGTIREAYNHPMQGGVSDILNLTCIAVKATLPAAVIAYTTHDAATWEVDEDKAEEYQARIDPIVQKEWLVGNVKVKFPCKWKPIIYGREVHEDA